MERFFSLSSLAHLFGDVFTYLAAKVGRAMVGKAYGLWPKKLSDPKQSSREQEFRMGGRKLSPWLVRPLALLLTLFLFFSGSPALFALSFSAGLRSSGSGSQAGGGQGSAANLQNAGAASAALTAELAHQSLQKSQAVINGLTTIQAEAAAAAKGNPANGTVNGNIVVNGLQISTPTGANQAPGLVPYYNTQNPAPSGPNIPTGSVPVPGTWNGVQSITQSTTGVDAATAPSSATVTITQNQQSAYLYWKNFNVGAQTKLNFNQTGNNGAPGTWIAFNKVMTPGDPSHIFGKINAPGQVYILNQGGILFHKGSSVNVQSLVAATLPINQVLAGDALDKVQGKGIVNFPNSVPQFLFTSLNKSSFDPNNRGNVTVSSLPGNVIVEPGAKINSSTASSVTTSDTPIGKVLTLSAVDGFYAGQAVTGSGIPSGTTIVSVDATANTITLSSPLSQSLPQSTTITATSADNSGGLVALVGPNVQNGGAISTPHGQAILAAGLEVALTPHPSSDPSLRGLDVAVNLEASSVTSSATPDGQVLNLSAVDGFLVGQTVSGSGIPAGTTIVAVDSTAKTITLSSAITQSLPESAIIKATWPASSVTSSATPSGQVLNLSAVDGFLVGQTVTGSGILAGTTIVAVDSTAKTITLSSAITQSLPESAIIKATWNSDSKAENASTGLIIANQGNITLAGSHVSQQGGIVSTTSVSFNGRVDLLADYNAKINQGYKIDGSSGPALYHNDTGLVDIGAGSAIQILPEWDSTVSVTGTALALNSIVSILGNHIEMGAGSILVAPGAVPTSGAISEFGKSLGGGGGSTGSGVSIQAGSWYTSGNLNDLQYTSGSITMDSGAVIDLAGSTDVQVSSAQNFITLQLRAAELANSPLQQTSPVRGKNITIDSRIAGTATLDGTTYSWVGTPLGDASGYVGLIQRAVGQLTLSGGTLSLQAGDKITMQSGSEVNVSGGWVQYSGGTFSTTRLVTEKGEIVDISRATPDQVYSGIARNVPPFYEAPYLSGGSGGSVTIQSPAIVLNGDLHGNTVAGFRQQSYTSIAQTPPTPSSLSLSLLSQRWDPVKSLPLNSSPYAPSISFSSGNSSTGALYLSPGLVQNNGFGILSVLNHDGTITVPPGAALNTGINGSVSLEAQNVDVEGSIVAPGGNISLKANIASYGVLEASSLIADRNQPVLDVVQYQGNAVAQFGPVIGGVTRIVNVDGTISQVSGTLPHYEGGIVTVGSSALISAAGTLVNSVPDSLTQASALNGGSVTIAGYQVNAERGSLLDVSSGALISATGTTIYGNGGSLNIASGQDTELGSIYHGSLFLNAAMRGYGGLNKAPGSLSISTQAIQIGGDSSDARVFHLDPLFFNQGGFGKFTMTGVGLKPLGVLDGFENPSANLVPYVPGLLIAPDTTIQPEVSNMLALATTSGGISTTQILLESPLRPFASLSFNAVGLNDPLATAVPNQIIRGDLVMGADSGIYLDPQLSGRAGNTSAKGGLVKMIGNTVTILGDITAPGGTISLKGDSSFAQNTTRINTPTGPQVTVDVASSALLSTAGVALYLPAALSPGRRSGSVLPGGNISASGNILMESGSTLIASGSSGVYDFLPYQLGIDSDYQSMTIPDRVDSAGGSIRLNGSQMLYSDATLSAHAGGGSAMGGSLSVSSKNFYLNKTLELANSYKDMNLTVTQSGLVAPPGFQDSGFSAIGQQLLSVSSSVPACGGHLAVNSFEGGGFDSVNLSGNVIFDGAQSGNTVTLSTPGQLNVASMGFLGAQGNTTINLNASSVALGMTLQAPLQPLSSAATAALGTSIYALPTWGQGSLNVDAKLISIGNSSLQGIGNVTLTARNGVVRGDGTLDMAGNLVISAAAVYPPSGTVFSIFDYNHSGSTVVSSGGTPGSIQVNQNGSTQLPLSAGGTLSFFAADIVQNGKLMAPLGVINLGWNGANASPVDPLTGAGTGLPGALLINAPMTDSIGLRSGSFTSVSAEDPITGQSLTVPYGISTGGANWVDLSGSDITTIGLPIKAVNLGANKVVADSGSKIDLNGGGSATATHWVSGNSGNINLASDSKGEWSAALSYSVGDVVTTTDSSGRTLYWTARQVNTGVKPSVSMNWSQVQPNYAVVPGYQLLYAPTGYSDGLIPLGSQIRINGGDGLPAGTYTLLPASYANLPGAYLVSPTSLKLGVGSAATQDGSVIATGTIFNGLDSSVTAPRTTTSFQILSPQQIARRAQYQLLDSGTFFQTSTPGSQSADAGNLVVQANSEMALNPSVLGHGVARGGGSRIDVSAPLRFDITADGSSGRAGDAVLSASLMNLWSYGSLLIGGVRRTTANGITPILVTATDVNLASGASLEGSDVILAANNSISVGAGSSITASGITKVPDKNLSVAGHGELLRVSSDENASSSRSIGNDITSVAGIWINASPLEHTSLTGASITIDSSGNATIDPLVVLGGQSINIAAAKIALNFDGSQESGSVLNIAGRSLTSLSTSRKLDLTSYSSIDFHGSGLLGSASLASLGLHAASLLGDNESVDTVQAVAIRLDNSNTSGGSGGAPTPTGGSLAITGSLLTIGNGVLSEAGFLSTTLGFSGGVEGKGQGSLAVAGDITINTPIFTATGSSSTAIASGGAFTATASGTSLLTPGLGASLTLEGSSLNLAVPILLPSGSVTLNATGANRDVVLSSSVNAAGLMKQIVNATEYTSGGSVTISSLTGNIILAGSSIDVSAPYAVTGSHIQVAATAGASSLVVSSGSAYKVGESVIGAGIAPGTLVSSIQRGGGAENGDIISLSIPTIGVISAGELLAIPSGGSGGSLTIFAPNGTLSTQPDIVNAYAPGGRPGNFKADFKSLNGGNLDPLESTLTQGGFIGSQNIRDRTDSSVSVTDAKANSYTLAADSGSVTVLGRINSSDVLCKDSLGNPIVTGGNIKILAGQSVVIGNGAILDVSGWNYDNAGKGGSIDLEAGNNPTVSVIEATTPAAAFASDTSVVDLQSGSTLNLGISAAPRTIDAAGHSDQFGGTLHLRAPQTIDNSDVQVNPIGATITGASLIATEGFYAQDAAQSDSSGMSLANLSGLAAIDSYVAPALNNAGTFMANATAISTRLLSLNGSLGSLLKVAPGEEIDNSLGSLVLNNDWDLSSARFGPNNNVPGFLTLRAAQNIYFQASLSDGFVSSYFNAALKTQNSRQPANFQSWAYQITAGADESAVNTQAVTSAVKGSVILGIPYQNGAQAQAPSPGPSALTSDALSGTGINYYQVIRTGSGNIAINASGDLQLWNQFASIYTVGTKVTDPTLGGTFSTPSPSNYKQDSTQLNFGAIQQAVAYAPQFSYAGGNISVNVNGNIGQWSLDANATPGSMVADSVRELPSNWLYRRGAVDSGGLFSVITLRPDKSHGPVSQVASTAWWVDFSNFFDDFGTLGGGNINLEAGGSISNVNASIPTNFRMAGKDSGGNVLLASQATGVELGGGNLQVVAGGNIDAGVFYVERGNALLQAAGSIITNPTRDPAAPVLTAPTFNNSPLSYLPTTFFLGKGSIDVMARGDVLLGPVANVFMTPQGINNGFWLSDYFSTYDPNDKVSVLSLGGNMTLRQSAATQASQAPLPLLQSWINNFVDPSDMSHASYYQPWLSVVETDISSDLIPTSVLPVGLAPLFSLMPSTLTAVSLSGDINLQGNLTFMPSPNGTLSLVVDGNINGLVQSGTYTQSATQVQKIYTASTINVSDANPDLIPGINSPLSKRSSLPSSKVNDVFSNGTKLSYTTDVSLAFFESGSINGQYATAALKTLLHGSNLLHAGDTAQSEIYAGNGSISGLQLFSPKATSVTAGQDITDIGFYIQNDTANSISIVSAGRNIIAYDPSSPLQQNAQAALSGSLQSGDIQVSGPGTLEVLAGGNVDLGVNPGNSGDSSVNIGITSIGNQRNPSLPFNGADLVVSSGVKLPTGLSSDGVLSLDSFAQTILQSPDASSYLSELSTQMKPSDQYTYTGDPLLSEHHTAADFGDDSTLTPEQKSRLELQLFYIVLANSYNKTKSFATTETAIKQVVNGKAGAGDIITWSQDIATINGGNINLFAPGGSITMGNLNYRKGGGSVAPGIITEGGGVINIFTKQDVSIGIGRIFSLKGGDITILSDLGNIAAGNSSKTVQSAPPTQVLLDLQSALVQTDLAGLATGGGIGTLQTILSAPIANIVLYAIQGYIDAGDAGIRASGNISVGAGAGVRNADNFQAGGLSIGVPAASSSSASSSAPASAPAVASAPSSAASTAAAAAANSSADKTADKGNSNQQDSTPSEYTITIDGYGGGDGDDDDKKAANAAVAPIQASL